MENLSNLSSNLPKGEDPLAQINSEILTQFKAAANSVASLYKASTHKTQVVYNKGYLQCLDDILEKINNSPNDLDQWLILKKLELEKSLEQHSDESDEVVKIPTVYQFNMENKHQINTKFRPTNPISSVERKSKRQNSYSSYSSPMKSLNNEINSTPSPAINTRDQSTSILEDDEVFNKEENEEFEQELMVEKSKRKISNFRSECSDKKPRFTD